MRPHAILNIPAVIFDQDRNTKLDLHSGSSTSYILCAQFIWQKRGTPVLAIPIETIGVMKFANFDAPCKVTRV